jgi:AcrR family transcriptional regulator
VTRVKLQARKQQVVREAIHDAAIGLFAVNGFDQTTVDEVAEAAGISRRSFFHYFVSKDDLLAQDTVKYGAALVEAVKTCPATSNGLELLRETVFAGIRYIAEQPHLRQVMEISQASTGARQAYASRSIEVEDSVSEACALRLKNASKFGMEPRLLAHLTLSVIRVAISAWFTGQHQDLSTAAKHALANLTRLTCDEAGSIHLRDKKNTSRKVVGSPIPRNRRSTVR